MKYILLICLNVMGLSYEAMANETQSEQYVVCNLEDHCCEIESSVVEGLEWRFGAKQFLKCSVSYFFGSNEEDYNECRRIVGNEFWEQLAEHVNEACDFSITQ